MLESKRRALIFLSISFLLAIAAGFLVLKKVSALNSELGGMTKVYVAAENIPSRTLIQPKQVKTTEIPNRYLNDSHVINVKDLINKVLVVPLSADNLITKSMIKPVSEATNENNRLITIPQTEIVRFDQELEMLDRVDIIISEKFDGKPDTRIFLKDIPVSNVLESKKGFAGIVVEVPTKLAPKIIHMQNYADSMRILKANVGKGKDLPAEPTYEEVEETEVKAEKKENEKSSQKTDDKKSGTNETKKEKDKKEGQ